VIKKDGIFFLKCSGNGIKKMCVLYLCLEAFFEVFVPFVLITKYFLFQDGPCKAVVYPALTAEARRAFILAFPLRSLVDDILPIKSKQTYIFGQKVGDGCSFLRKVGSMNEAGDLPSVCSG
jgi:hypothetical protein